MTQELTLTWCYDIPAYRAFQVRNRIDYLTAKAKFTGVGDFRLLELREREGYFRNHATYTIEVPLPLWARRFFSPRNTVTQYHRWHPPQPDGSRVCDIRDEVANVPVEIAGSLRLQPEGFFGTRFDLQLTVESAMRVFGGKLESLVMENVRRVVEADRDFGFSYPIDSTPQRF